MAKVKITLSREWLCGSKRYGPGTVNVSEEVAERLQRAENRVSGKREPAPVTADLSPTVKDDDEETEDEVITSLSEGVKKKKKTGKKKTMKPAPTESE